MVPFLNILVRKYLRRFDAELTNMKSFVFRDQASILRSILTNRYTDYFFNDIVPNPKWTYDEFVQKYPLTNYSNYRLRMGDLMKDRRHRPEYFAQSSGTLSNDRKLIPTTELFLRQNHLRASWYILYTLYNHHQNASIFLSKNLLVGGSIYEKHRDYVVGDVSGIMMYRIPSFFQPACLPNIKTATLPDFDDKLRRTAELAAKTKRISLIGGTPTWVLTVVREVLKLRNCKSLSEVWPDIQAYIHGGVSIVPYRDQFNELLGKSKCLFLETYNASEGFFAFQDRPDEDGLLLMTNNGIFYEFIPYIDYFSDKRTAVTLEEVVPGKKYVILISTICGLIRYEIGDVVEFTSINPFRLKVMGRTTEFINACGEDLLLDQADRALNKTIALHKCEVIDFTVAPFYQNIHRSGYHEWFIEFAKMPTSMDQFSFDLDQALRGENQNYDQKRTADLALSKIVVRTLPKGTFRKYFNRNKRYNGQSKIQKLRNDRHLAHEIVDLITN